MKRRRILFTAVLALLLVAALAITALAQEADGMLDPSEVMQGPDEVYEGGSADVVFNSPVGGGMEGKVTTSDNLTFQNKTSPNGMAAQISTEDHVFSLFGDPVTYTYSVSGAAGDQVCVTLSDAEQSNANGDLATIPEQQWTATVQSSSQPSAQPSGEPSSQPSGQPSSQPSSSKTLDPIPSLQPSASQPIGPGPIVSDNSGGGTVINITNNNYNTNTNTNYVPIRYPAYAPRPVAQRTVYRSYDGMPKMGDESSAVNYWALLTIGALLGVVALVAATQVYSYRKNGRVNVTIIR